MQTNVGCFLAYQMLKLAAKVIVAKSGKGSFVPLCQNAAVVMPQVSVAPA